MNTDILHGKWHQLKGRVKATWGRLTDDKLDQVDGNAERLVGVIQERDGCVRDEAEKQVRSAVHRQTKQAFGQAGNLDAGSSSGDRRAQGRTGPDRS